MSREFAIKTLGPSKMIHSYRAPSQGDSSKWIEYTDYEWHWPDRILYATVDDKGEVLSVTLNQRRGSTRGPFGVMLGRDSVLKAIETRIGDLYVQPAIIKCSDVEAEEGDYEVLFAFEASCGPEGSLAVELYAPIKVQPELKQYCNKPLPIDQLKKAAGALTVRSATMQW